MCGRLSMTSARHIRRFSSHRAKSAKVLWNSGPEPARGQAIGSKQRPDSDHGMGPLGPLSETSRLVSGTFRACSPYDSLAVMPDMPRRPGNPPPRGKAI